MTENTIEFAWAIPVKVEILGAHLEAYDNLEPLIKALRMCNRFGRGEKAFITKLPVELIQQVEDHLMSRERAKLRGKWAKNLRCWEDRCSTLDHLSNDAILGLYNETCEHRGCASSDSCMQPATKVNANIKSRVKKLLEREFADGKDAGLWEEGHDERVAAWFTLVGTPTAKTRGKLGQLSSILRDHFGVESWISHIQEERKAKFSITSNVHSTKAYLRLRERTKVQYSAAPDYDNWYHHPIRTATEVGYASALVLPPQETDKSLTRFSRAVKMLNLDYTRPESSVTVTAPTEENVKPVKATTEKHSSKNESHVQPQLTMFVRSDDETSDY